VRSSTRKTTVKTRVIGGNQHLLRVDNEDIHPITLQEEKDLITAVIRKMDEGLDAIIFEDYNKGVLTSTVISTLVSEANKRKIISAVDPKKDNFFEFKEVTLFKPNLKELREGLNADIDMEAYTGFEEAVDALEKELNNKISFITLSEYGVFVKEGSEKHKIPAHLRKIADVSGAGDTVISVATACLAAGMKPYDMAQIANLAGGLVCERSGVVAIDKDLLWLEVQRVYNGH
jgi:rfaE bifunctional protein kinase chain/domain